MCDLGFSMKPVLVSAHSLHRQAIGRMKHIDAPHLLPQTEVRSNRLKVRRVKGEHNPTDQDVKALSRAVIVRHAEQPATQMCEQPATQMCEQQQQQQLGNDNVKPLDELKGAQRATGIVKPRCLEMSDKGWGQSAVSRRGLDDDFKRQSWELLGDCPRRGRESRHANQTTPR